MNELCGKIQTVCGLIDPAELGPTLMHEHVLCDFTLPDRRGPAGEFPEIALETRWDMNYRSSVVPGIRCLLDRDAAAREMEIMLESGGRALVDVSTHPMVLDPDGLRLVSERTGAHIVRGCGRYTGAFMSPSDLDRGIDDLLADIVADIREGAGETGVRAGIIGEVGCSWPWTEAERRSVKAAVIAQRETGAALSIHPGQHPESPIEIAAFVKDAGADMSRVIMDHVERRMFRIDDYLRLADTGCVLEFDLFGMETTYFGQLPHVETCSDLTRLNAIRALIDAGHGDRVLMSHDICVRTRQAQFGGHGYGHIFRNIVPLMRQREFTEAEIDGILTDNPARLLAFA